MLPETENIILLVVKYSKIAVCKIILILHMTFLSCCMFSYNSYYYICCIYDIHDIVYTTLTLRDLWLKLFCTAAEWNIPVMVACTVAGAVAVLGVLAVYWMVRHIKNRKRAKKGLIAVQAIAPLPPRATALIDRRPRSTVLAFV